MYETVIFRRGPGRGRRNRLTRRRPPLRLFLFSRRRRLEGGLRPYDLADRRLAPSRAGRRRHPVRLVAVLALAVLPLACAEPDTGPPSADDGESRTAPTTPRTSPATHPTEPGADPDVDPRRTTDGTGPTTPSADEPVTVAIAGDVMLGRRVGEHLERAGDPAAVLRPTGPRLRRADLTVGNLESTLARLGAPTQGDDSFAADPGVLDGLRDVSGFDVLSLANNHTGDFGTRSLLRTVRLVHDAGIVPVGAGADRREAWSPAIVERKGTTFGIIAFNAIGETPGAGADSPGAASVRMEPRTGPLSATDLDRARREVRRLADRVDVVIVLPHWGDQYTHRPVPDQRRVARALVRAGADAVVGGHPHWTQPDERYRGALIIYSLGNFVFDMDWNREVRTGNVAELTFRGGRLVGFELVPYVIGRNDFTPRFTR